MTNIGDLIRAKSIYKVEEIEKVFDAQAPRSVFKPCYDLSSGLHCYYRRGDYPAYSGNFIPLWVYALLLDKILLHLPVYRDSTQNSTDRHLYDYCGVTLDQLLELINNLDVVIPLVDDAIDDYGEGYRHFFETVPEKSVIRARLFEDATLGQANFAFTNRVKIIEQSLQSFIESYSAEPKEEYNYWGHYINPLIPPLDKLPKFLAERIVWQQVARREASVQNIYIGISEGPLRAYEVARLSHYFVVPRFYSRKGFTAFATGEIQRTRKGYEGPNRITLIDLAPFLRSSLPLSSKPFTLDFAFPETGTHQEVAESMRLVAELVHGELTEERHKLLRTMEQFCNVPTFYEKPLETFERNTREIFQAVDRFNKRLKKFAKDRKAMRLGVRVIAPTLSQVAINRMRTNLAKAEEARLGFLAAAFPFLKNSAADKKGLPRLILQDLDELQSQLELEEREPDTPFIILEYPNPPSPYVLVAKEGEEERKIPII